MRTDPYNYTGKTVVGPKKFNKLVQFELTRVKTLKGVWNPTNTAIDSVKGYEARYPYKLARNGRKEDL